MLYRVFAYHTVLLLLNMFTFDAGYVFRILLSNNAIIRKKEREKEKIMTYIY